MAHDIRTTKETNTGCFTSESATTTTHHIIVGGSVDDIAAEIEAGELAALQRGETIIRLDGSKVWRTRTPQMTDDDQYVWHDDSERILCDRFQVTWREGQRTQKKLRSVWVLWDNAH